MELELNIYEKGEVVKTHKAATHILPWGIVEDALEIIDDGDDEASCPPWGVRHPYFLP